MALYFDIRPLSSNDNAERPRGLTMIALDIEAPKTSEEAAPRTRLTTPSWTATAAKSSA